MDIYTLRFIFGFSSIYTDSQTPRLPMFGKNGLDPLPNALNNVDILFQPFHHKFIQTSDFSTQL